MVFIHGFNVSFTEAVEAAAWLAESMLIDGRQTNVVLLSWPSDGPAMARDLHEALRGARPEGIDSRIYVTEQRTWRLAAEG